MSFKLRSKNQVQTTENKTVKHDRTFLWTFEEHLKPKKKRFNLKTFDNQHEKKLISCDIHKRHNCNFQ